jgi:hypothetical protein
MLKNGSSEVKQDGFSVKHNMKVPDFIDSIDSSVHNQNKCETDCLKNCSCLAHAYDPYIGCMYWSRELVDLQKFSYGAGVDLFIRVPAELGMISLFLSKNLLLLFRVRLSSLSSKKKLIFFWNICKILF